MIAKQCQANDFFLTGTALSMLFTPGLKSQLTQQKQGQLIAFHVTACNKRQATECVTRVQNTFPTMHAGSQ
jgi:hypothetical protein